MAGGTIKLQVVVHLLQISKYRSTLVVQSVLGTNWRIIPSQKKRSSALTAIRVSQSLTALRESQNQAGIGLGTHSLMTQSCLGKHEYLLRQEQLKD